MALMELNGGEQVVASLERSGIRLGMGIVGSSILEVFDLLPQSAIQYVGVRHEQVAGHMADAYARVSRQPAACLVQNGAGLTNLVTGVATAWRARSPMVVVSGSPTSAQLFTDTYQEIDHVHIMRPITKWSHLVNRPDRIAEAVHEAVRIATTPPYGPTFVDIPRDFLYEVANITVRDREQVVPHVRPEPTRRDLDAALRLLQQATHPVILAGGGVAWADAGAAVGHLAEVIHAPVCTTYGHNDAVASAHPWYLGSLGRGGSKAAMEAFRQADLVLAIGTRLDPFTFLPYYGDAYVPASVRILQVNNNPQDLGRSRPIECGVYADAAAFSEALAGALGQNPVRSAYTLEQLERWRTSWREELSHSAEWAGDGNPLTMEAAYQGLARTMPDNVICTADIGSSPSFAYSMLSYSGPVSLLPPLGLGGVGFSLPAALGAKLAAPNRPVVALMGDGALSMSLPALFTAHEHRIPITAVVFDNRAWGAEKANQQYFYDAHYVGTNLDTPNLTTLAQAMGIDAVTADTPDAVAEALREASQQNDVAHVIRIPVDPERFPLPARRDALKKPVRHLYK